MNKREVKMLEFPQRGDKRGHLVIVEGMKDVPFDIKRIFYIYGSDKRRSERTACKLEKSVCFG